MTITIKVKEVRYYRGAVFRSPFFMQNSTALKTLLSGLIPPGSEKPQFLIGRHKERGLGGSPPKIAAKIYLAGGIDKHLNIVYTCVMTTESVKLTSIRVTTDDLLSIGRAAKVLNISRRTLYNWVEDNKLVTITLGGILFVPTSEIERLSAARR